jgi:hypothetical protein
LWAFAAGFLGLLLFLLWTVTNHVFAHQNENLLLLHPLWLVLAVLGPMTAVKGRLARTTRWMALGFAGLAVVALLMHVVGVSRQANLEIIALTLPPILAIAWAMHRGTARSRVASVR